jgi:hypothetical protein
MKTKSNWKKTRWHEKKAYRGETPINAKGAEDVIFRIHFPKNILSERMSALEVGSFVLGHLVTIEGMGLCDHLPCAHVAIKKLINRFIKTPTKVLDRVWGWCAVHIGKEEDDVVEFTPIWVEERADMAERAASIHPIIVNLPCVTAKIVPVEERPPDWRKLIVPA